MHCAMYDIRVWWEKLCDRFAAAVLLSLPVRELENYDDIVTASLYDNPIEELIGDELRDIETRVGELLMYRISPAPNPIFWEFPRDLVYTFYKPRY